MLKIKNSTKFKKDIKRFQHHQAVLEDLGEILKLLCKQIPLAEHHHDHNLTGPWKGHRECHIRPDVLLIYVTDESTLFLERLGSHSELFKR